MVVTGVTEVSIEMASDGLVLVVIGWSVAAK